MMRKVLLSSVGLVLTLAAFLALRLFSAPVGVPKLSVTFLAFTNDSAGVRLSVITLSNAGPASIYRICSYRITGPSGKNSDTLTNAPLSDGYYDRILHRGDSETILIRAPIDQKQWRARFDFWTYRGAIGSSVEDVVMWMRRKIGMKIVDVRVWGTGISEVIAE